MNDQFPYMFPYQDWILQLWITRGFWDLIPVVFWGVTALIWETHACFILVKTFEMMRFFWFSLGFSKNNNDHNVVCQVCQADTGDLLWRGKLGKLHPNSDFQTPNPKSQEPISSVGGPWTICFSTPRPGRFFLGGCGERKSTLTWSTMGKRNQ